MAGMDHEFSVGGLFALEASAVMLGHIHKHQTWQNDGRMIAYAGSLCRLHHGEIGDNGGLSPFTRNLAITSLIFQIPIRPPGSYSRPHLLFY